MIISMDAIKIADYAAQKLSLFSPDFNPENFYWAVNSKTEDHYLLAEAIDFVPEGITIPDINASDKEWAALYDSLLGQVWSVEI